LPAKAIRSVMTENRLSGLALMKIHRDYCEKLLCLDKMKELVQKFAQLNLRRMSLSFVLDDR